MSSSSNGSPEVVVYGRQGCVQCTATGRKMQAMGVAYTYKDVASEQVSREAEQVASRLGARQLPLVVARPGVGRLPAGSDRAPAPPCGGSEQPLPLPEPGQVGGRGGGVDG